MLISIIIPTIKGREESYAQMVAAYRERTPGHTLNIVTPRDFPNWAAACNEGMTRAKGKVFAFGSDDLEPLPGWADAMLGTLKAGEIPAPQLWNYVQDGPPVNEVQDGPPGSITAFSRVVALTREMAEQIGPWPEMDYYTDNWVSDKARTLGIETRVTAGYGFIHHWHQVGRLDQPGWQNRSLPQYNAERAKLGLPPTS